MTADRKHALFRVSFQTSVIDFSKASRTSLFNGELKQQRRQREREKAVGLDWKNNNFALASPVLVHFFGVAARLQREGA